MSPRCDWSCDGNGQRPAQGLAGGSVPFVVPCSAIDLDVTDDCNCACTYCFKGPKTPRYMSGEVARAGVDWLIRASQGVKDISINFMGGEPLLAWDLIRSLVPWARRRCQSYGKDVRFSMTTNLTLMNDEVRRYVDEHGFGVLMSIDGCPELQDMQRPLRCGGSTSRLVEKWARSMLKSRPRSDARMTLTPAGAHLLFDSCVYLSELGFVNLMPATCDYPDWTDQHMRTYESELERVAGFVADRYMSGRPLRVKAFDYYMKKVIKLREAGKPIPRKDYACGAGYNYQMIDFEGNIWPCHRFDGAIQAQKLEDHMKMGTVFEGVYNHRLERAFQSWNFNITHPSWCEGCPLEPLCGDGCPAGNLYFTRDIYTPVRRSCQIGQLLYRVAESLYRLLMKKKCQTFIDELEDDTP